ncbi:MAG: prohibitin family protein [Deltaproteobacteria bacterium]|nr:prohibitin family protein [Deltaproteobacteria bacterium]
MSKTAIILIILIVLGVVSTTLFERVPAGHVGVVTLFGKVQDKTYSEGLHFPVNPFYNWIKIDARQKTHYEKANVPSQDQMTTHVDVSIQYRLNGEMAAKMYRETGGPKEVIEVHLVPKLRSLMREQGKSVQRAEDFFLEGVQQKLQDSILAELAKYLAPKGIVVQAVLIRDIELPEFIVQAVKEKKKREQEAQKQKAELERFKTEQQQKVASAEAERRAAEEQAKKQKILADAKAYEIEKINDAIKNNPAYVQLQSLEALKAISNDSSSKVYFINGDSPQPLPLMNLGK